MSKTIIMLIENHKISYKMYEGDVTRDIDKAIDLKEGLTELGRNITFEEFNKRIKREII